ncbi:MAG: hydrogenase formation protein HypD [Desulfobacterales bacterium]
MKHIEEYRDGKLSRRIIEQIAAVSHHDLRIMEVCGTHTVSIFRNGIRTVLPENVSLISGPGCPVCVTDQREIDTAIALAEQENVIIATFGDLIRVPGTFSSLQSEQAAGRDIRIVYSTFDAITLAKENPEKNVVFLGIGFETTAPTIAASVLAAQKAGITNYFVYSAHKLMPPALKALMDLGVSRIDGFLLPGHVSVIIGTRAYADFFEKYRIPCVIAGFEPVDILQALFNLTEMINSGSPRLENAYTRAVTEAGNTEAIKIMHSVFEPCDASWRGIGRISGSGLRFRPDYASFDAKAYFDPDVPEAMPPKGCACGDILTGMLTPPECPLYKKKCTPVNPVGPCMVSSEGTCAAYYKYHD